MATISVIVPVYKVEKHIHRCIDSILAQTFTDFELILVDDGSPDNCGKICDEYAEKDARIIVIHQNNGGLSAARNAGLDWAFANSNSEWISFIDSDDWIDCDYLSYLFKSVRNTNTNIGICSSKKVENTVLSKLEKKDHQVLEFAPEPFFCDYSFLSTVAWGKIYKKALFNNLRYPIGKINEDEFVTYKLLFSVDKVSYVSLPLYFYFVSNESIMRSKWSENKMVIFDALREQELFFRSNGYQKAWKALLKSVDWNTNYLLSLAETKNNQKRVIKELKHFLRLFKNCDLIKSEPKLYAIAYPFKSWLYWTYKGILSKFKKK